MPTFDVDSADGIALANEQIACEGRMEVLKSEYERERQLRDRIVKRLDVFVRDLVIDEKEARRIESHMLKAGSRIITNCHKTSSNWFKTFNGFI